MSWTRSISSTICGFNGQRAQHGQQRLIIQRPLFVIKAVMLVHDAVVVVHVQLDHPGRERLPASP